MPQITLHSGGQVATISLTLSKPMCLQTRGPSGGGTGESFWSLSASHEDGGGKEGEKGIFSKDGDVLLSDRFNLGDKVLRIQSPKAVLSQ